MASEQTGTDGPDTAAIERQYQVSQKLLASILSYSSRAAFDDLLSDYEGPFRGLYQVVDRFERDGKQWARIQHYASRHLIDIEVEVGAMMSAVAVPAAEAYRLALEQDARERNQAPKQRPGWLEALLNAVAQVPQDAQSVLEQPGFETERQHIFKTLLGLFQDDIDKQMSEGKTEAMLEAKRETARKLKLDGLPVENISRYTRLSGEEIGHL